MTRPTSGAPSWCSVSRRMSMYQSASRPEESVTFPCTTASSTISSRRRSRSGRAGAAVMGKDPTDAAPQHPSRSALALRLEHLVDDVDGRVRRLHVAADHRRRLTGDGLGAGDGEVLARALDGHGVFVQGGLLAGELVGREPALDD